MRLPEFQRASTGGKLASSKPKMSNCMTDVSSLIPDPEFVELLWENGQIVMQSQSNRHRKTSRVQEKYECSQFAATDLAVNETSCENIRVNVQDNNMIPWISNYPIEDEFFSELAGFSGSSHKDFHSMEECHTFKAFREGSEPSRIRATQQCHSSMMNQGDLGSDFAEVELRSVDHKRSINGNNRKSPVHQVKHHQSTSFEASVAVGRREAEKGPEAIVASSLCSGASNEPENRRKRKKGDEEEFSYQSENLDDQSAGMKKSNGERRLKSIKRNRAAEVHNLSERRRRDRINEKMRTLQGLIPNCNKVDKAYMLDQAIEYLKTLQIQLQMMSTGSGLCMPPMILPLGMKQIYATPMAHFSPMGIGMGMGMGLGYGLGMLNMNGPQFPTSQIPSPLIPGAAGYQLFGMPGQDHSQGLPVPLPHGSPFSLLSPLATQRRSMNQSNDQPKQKKQCTSLEGLQNTINNEPKVANKELNSSPAVSSSRSIRNEFSSENK